MNILLNSIKFYYVIRRVLHEKKLTTALGNYVTNGEL